MKAEFLNTGIGVSYEHIKVESNERRTNKKSREQEKRMEKVTELMKQNLKAYGKCC